jgi:hypothetical protein
MTSVLGDPVFIHATADRQVDNEDVSPKSAMLDVSRAIGAG